jgi:hypothetical protein
LTQINDTHGKTNFPRVRLLGDAGARQLVHLEHYGRSWRSSGVPAPELMEKTNVF